ncbi:MAG: MATE family efflux transporter [Pirellulales bacterium]|nr:MATE family efflux transporter [Pirellulales bacterium]
MVRTGLREWWLRPCGGREVSRLALPLVVSTGSWTIMNFVDRMFLMWTSTEAMAAALPAGMLHFTMLCFPLGVATYVNTFVAQYEGAGRPDRIGLAVWQGVLVGLFCIPIFLAIIPLAPWIFRIAGHSAELAAMESTYFQIISTGAGAAIIAGALSSFFTGRGDNRYVMFVSVTSALLNVALDYVWIFGRFGFPEMGIAGAAWATAVSQWYRVAAYVWLMHRAKWERTYRIRAGRRWDAALFGRLLRFGGPNGLQMLVEICAFTLFLMLVGRLGKTALAATTLAFNVNSVAFIPMLGVGIAISTMVGRQLGRGQPDLAARATWSGLWIAMVYMSLFAASYVLVPDLFLLGHKAGANPDEFAQVRDLTVVLLRFVAAYCLFDALNIVFVAAIRGAGDTRFVLLTNLLFCPLPVVAAWAGITWLGWGLMACWVLLTAWAMSLGMIYLGRFLQGRWRTMRVIEPDLPLNGNGESLSDATPTE